MGERKKKEKKKKSEAVIMKSSKHSKKEKLKRSATNGRPFSLLSAAIEQMQRHQTTNYRIHRCDPISRNALISLTQLTIQFSFHLFFSTFLSLIFLLLFFTNIYGNTQKTHFESDSVASMRL